MRRRLLSKARLVPVSFCAAFVALTFALVAPGCGLDLAGSGPAEIDDVVDASVEAGRVRDANTTSDGSTSAACDADTRVDPSHCGACGAQCFAGPHETAQCQAGTCVRTCERGFATCATAPLSDAGADSGAEPGCATELANDALNCGRCGRSCFGGACVAGECAPVAVRTDIVGLPDALVWDDATTLYWTVRPSQGSTRAGAYGHSFVTGADTFSATLSDPLSIAVRSGRVFVSESSNSPKLLAFDLDASADGGAPSPTVLATLSNAAPDLATDGTYVYWTTYDSNVNIGLCAGNDGKLSRLPLRPTATDRPDVFDDDVPRPFSLAVQGSDIFVATLCNRAVLRYSNSSVPGTVGPGTMSNQFTKAVDVAVFGNTLFVADNATGEIGPSPGGLWRIVVPALTGTSTPERLTGQGSTPRRVAVDETYVYWTDDGPQTSGKFEQGSVLRLERGAPAGTTPTVLARGQRQVRGIAVSAKAIAWTTWDDHTVHVLAK